MSRHVDLGVHVDEVPPKLGSLGLQSRDLPLEVVPLETGNGLRSDGDGASWPASKRFTSSALARISRVISWTPARMCARASLRNSASFAFLSRLRMNKRGPPSTAARIRPPTTVTATPVKNDPQSTAEGP